MKIIENHVNKEERKSADKTKVAREIVKECWKTVQWVKRGEVSYINLNLYLSYVIKRTKTRCRLKERQPSNFAHCEKSF